MSCFEVWVWFDVEKLCECPAIVGFLSNIVLSLDTDYFIPVEKYGFQGRYFEDKSVNWQKKEKANWLKDVNNHGWAPY